MTAPNHHVSAPDAFTLNQKYFRDKYGDEFVEGSPHLKHATVGSLCASLAADAYTRVAAQTERPAVLDMGAGDGVLTLPYLKLGCEVVAADASDELLKDLQAKAKGYEAALMIMPGDIFETLAKLEKEHARFDIICASSFLHHIPDYVALCRAAAGLLAPGGVFYTFQDPLRYNSLGRGTYLADRMGYFSWRLAQGNYMRGIKTRLRRLRGTYRSDLPEDVAEYHVVRNGVDQDTIREFFERAGFVCSITPYWSTQSTLFQRVGEKLGLANTFSVMASRPG